MKGREIGLVAQFLIQHSNKVGVDLDSPSQFQLLKTYFNTRYMFPDKEIEIYRSANGEGYHIIVYGVKSTLKVREMLGDCSDRMRYSEKRSGIIETGDEVVDDVMFDTKMYHRCRITKMRHRERISEWNLTRAGFWE